MAQRKTDGTTYRTISITAKDRTGLVHDIAGTISRMNLTILRHEARVCNQLGKGMLSKSTLEVAGAHETDFLVLLHRLKKIKGVLDVQMTS